MLTKCVDQHNKFYELFDSKTGLYIRSGVINNGRDTGVDPLMRTFPGLIDVGVMGHCNHGMSGYCHASGTQCYQNGRSIVKENMSFNNFRKIVDQCKGKVFQFALGGRGDVDQHENCEEILAYSRNNGIAPNFTTSGYNLSHRIVDMLKHYVGAVAVSWYRAEYTTNAINNLINAGIKTNIHYILGNNTIEEAIDRLNNNSFPEGI
ncbi:MAG: radical SAM protein, partial [Oscillospiraceae bacterium]|nr:radical SAM protein [Oscillospiraceae bacterium]